ncbi:hypothetical protein Tco_0872450, partial [Tanacetum coccineum]
LLVVVTVGRFSSILAERTRQVADGCGNDGGGADGLRGG